MVAMIIQKAKLDHINGIERVCSSAYRATYQDTHTEEYIERTIRDFYNSHRLEKEVRETSKEWGGYFVATEGERVVGAGGGGLISEEAGEVYVLYLDPTRRNEGIGSMLLEQITHQQKEWGANEQWVSVQKGNTKGIPFYEARGFTYQTCRQGFGNKLDEHYISLRYKRSI